MPVPMINCIRKLENGNCARVRLLTHLEEKKTGIKVVRRGSVLSYM